jgi:hypothetical protein
MKLGNDRNYVPSPLGPFLRSLVAQMIVCKFISHIRLSGQAAARPPQGWPWEWLDAKKCAPARPIS